MILSDETPNYYYRRDGRFNHHFDYAWGVKTGLYEQIYAWCKENCADGDWYYLAGAFNFAREDDAFAFRMRWC